jgi:CelD/BcsL family acetyltransferase involved in cellulose biosynthesis
VLRTSLVTRADGFAELQEPWRELVAGAPTATPFQTWEWQSTWWKHFGGSKGLHLLQIHEGGDLVGLMPMTLGRAPWRTLRPLGNGASDYLHPISREGFEGRVAAAIVDHFMELGGIDLVDLHQVRQSEPLVKLMEAGTQIEQATCLVLDLPGTYDEYLATLGKSLRYDVRRLDKKLFQDGGARIVPVGSEGIAEGMEQLFETHRRRWRRRGLPGAFVGARTQRFHEEWAHLAAREGMLWLSLLEVDGKNAGAIYAMTLGNACYYYQAGFDPSVSRISPGTLLVAHTIRRAIEEGKTRFDFLRGDEPYKRRWKPQHELRNYRLIAPAQSLPGRAGLAWNQAGSRVESRLRARLEGRGLL